MVIRRLNRYHDYMFKHARPEGGVPLVYFHLERTGGSLVVRSTHGQAKWAGAFFVAFAIFGLFIVAPDLPQKGFYSLLFGVPFVGIGLYLLLAEVRTIFDLRSRRVVHTFTLAWYQRRWDYSFTDVASVGVAKSLDDGVRYYSPVITLRNGRIHRLLAGHCDNLIASNLVAEICETTGLNVHA